MYTTAKTVLRELRDMVKMVYPVVSIPPGVNPVVHDLPAPPVFLETERTVRNNAVKYLLWEQKNPLELELNSEIGKREYVNRMKGVYRRAIVKLRFFSEVWWAGKALREDDADLIAQKVLVLQLDRRAGSKGANRSRSCWHTQRRHQSKSSFVSLLTDIVGYQDWIFKSVMLNFALTEQYELRGQKDEVEAVLQNLLEKFYQEMLNIETKVPGTVISKETESSLDNASTSDKEKRNDGISGLLKLRVKEAGQVWIMYLRFAWRSKGYQDMRNVFKQARTDEKRYPSRFLDWRVWEFAGKMQPYKCWW
jgi:cleavage stimulation factor subunit 3